ncbi:MAG: deoxyribose-phosphate aldolase [Clostridia bacterium]|nr:deoxyribose-phosphate aldolase [Clostridia bacterium]
MEINDKIQNILSACDHTLLSTTATWADIREICNDGMKYGTASVCIPPAFVARAREYVGKKLKICTVIGFPNGYQTTEVKVFETQNAIANGADEIDMVINVGELKARNFSYLIDEISQIKKACGDKILKVIIETCLLTDTEKMEMCRVVTLAGADFIKTSTGFSTGGATFDDVKLMRDSCDPAVKVKAAGGISSLEDAQKFLDLGADRLGTSRVVKIVKNEKGSGY